MKVLFLCSGNSLSFPIVPSVQAQAKSLINIGHKVGYSKIKGKGALAYLAHIFRLRKHLYGNSYDVVHAHYSLSGFVASFATIGLKQPVIVSLMGSDVKGARLGKVLVRCFAIFIWKATIVKSVDMQKSLGVVGVDVIPNGIDLEVFKHIRQDESRYVLNWSAHTKYILFGADPTRDVKNYPLAQEAHKQLFLSSSHMTKDDCKIITLDSIPHEQVPVYLNACDVLLLTSKWEGSPNIIKEAMACGTPIVCTDVGDVKWLLDGLEGCYVTKHDPSDVSQRLNAALHFEGKTEGRERIIELGLDSVSIANRLEKVYKRALKR